ncbi:MAG TPA: hypothetical protein VHZ73_10195 [Vicinamibacterales bacterium]|jgi:hypothetical protein|nr:hypothetical protein [Vicinamibacterales bacterium]
MQPTVWDMVPASKVAQECFADEIAIDFPSVDHVVERLRDRFLGEPPRVAMLTTEVLLSKRDRTFGTVVTLDVPVRRTCARCGGRGEVWTDPCDACDGGGERVERHPLRVPVPPGVADGARFRFRVSSPGAQPVRVEVRVASLSPAA